MFNTEPQTEQTQAKRSTFTSSLAFKIVIPVVGVIALTCLFLFAIYSKRLEAQGNEMLRRQLASYATSKAAELTEPLWSFQSELIYQLMHSYRDNQNLFSVRLYDLNDQLIEQEVDICNIPYSMVITTERLLTKKTGGEEFKLGKLVIQYHDGVIMADIKNRSESDIAFTCVLMAILAGTIWLSIHVLIGRPLRRIKTSLDENMGKGERMPLKWSSHDELGDVVIAYNSLLHEVEMQTSALINMNKTLRFEVENRIIAEKELSKVHDQLEHTVAMRTLELNLANHELLDLDQQRAAFLSSASHELRTPLAAVLGFATLIKKHFNKFFMPVADEHALRKKGEVILNNLDIINREGGRLTRLIDDLLDLNKIEAGHMEWRDSELNIPMEIHRSVMTMNSAVENNPNVNLKVTMGEEFPSLIFDPDRFQQLLINLLSNAIKHTKAGVVRLEAGSDQHTVTITVSDTGKGIPKDDLEFIFHKFYQSGDDPTYRPTGTGLGLPICKNIVEHYGGEISVQSEMGAGSTFTVTLPANLDVPKMF